MKCYVGVKMVQAEPMEKDGKEGYKVVYPDGYESWSPKEVFEEAYFGFDYKEQAKWWKDRFAVEIREDSMRLKREAERRKMRGEESPQESLGKDLETENCNTHPPKKH